MLNGQVEEWAKTLTSHKKQHYQNTIDFFTRDGLDFHQAISENGVYGRYICVTGRCLPLSTGSCSCMAGLPKPVRLTLQLIIKMMTIISKGITITDTFWNAIADINYRTGA
ncbi:hypothetical protein MASR1M12_34740 [Erysipelotrichia bacterium]